MNHFAESLQSWQNTGQTFLHRGNQIFYKADGSGESLICLHGFPTASWDWHKIWDRLTSKFRVLAPDFIGFGFSSKPRSYSYSIMDQADLIEGLLAEQSIDTYHILAHNYGDTVAQELLARDLDRKEQGLSPRILSTVLLNGGLFPETHRPRPIQRLLSSPIGFLIGRLLSEPSFNKRFSAVFGPGTQPEPEELAAFWKLVHQNQGTRISHLLIRYMKERVAYRERWVRALRESSVQIRLINGAADPVSGAHMVQRYQEVVDVPDLVSFPNIGHYPQTEAPDQTWAALYDFWKKLDLFS